VGLRRRGPTAALQAAATTALALGAVVVLAVLAGCGGSDGPEAGAAPTSPTTPTVPPQTVPPPAGKLPPSMQPNEVSPEDAVDLRTLPWTSAEPVEGGRQLRVLASLDGGPPCTVLARVDLEEGADEVTVTLWVGRRPDADCSGERPALGFPAVTSVDLSSPLGRRGVRDGANALSRAAGSRATSTPAAPGPRGSSTSTATPATRASTPATSR
jgi:hypothetical protein